MGTWKPGVQLPGVAEICERFDASTATAVYAMHDLGELVDRRQGTGYFVSKTPAGVRDSRPQLGHRCAPSPVGDPRRAGQGDRPNGCIDPRLNPKRPPPDDERLTGGQARKSAARARGRARAGRDAAQRGDDVDAAVLSGWLPVHRDQHGLFDLDAAPSNQ